VTVTDEILDAARDEWAPDDDPVFQLVPPLFQEIISSCYAAIGRPVVSFDTFWDIYLHLREAIEEGPVSQQITTEIETHFASIHEENAQLHFPDLGELNDGRIQVGGAQLYEGKSSINHHPVIIYLQNTGLRA
jgi:hypothetical protein